MEQKPATKNYTLPIILVLVVLVILAGVWYWWKQKEAAKVEVTPPAPTAPPPTAQPPTPPKPVEKVAPKEDSVTAINQDLDKIETLDLEKQFQEIDQDLNSL
jgi:uncharacterized protein HemX